MASNRHVVAYAARPDASIVRIDHPSNPGQPTLWHVRDDGWMEASFNQRGPYELNKDQPLVLRYLLHVHRGDLDDARAEAVFLLFAGAGHYELARVAATRQSLRLGIAFWNLLLSRSIEVTNSALRVNVNDVVVVTRAKSSETVDSEAQMSATEDIPARKHLIFPSVHQTMPGVGKKARGFTRRKRANGGA
ncbi:MAG: PmoA family protein [Planctomycetes bacterium]|nr:PmoA family protein [Planctomycetota bacterium]